MMDAGVVYRLPKQCRPMDQNHNPQLAWKYQNQFCSFCQFSTMRRENFSMISCYFSLLPIFSFGLLLNMKRTAGSLCLLYVVLLLLETDQRVKDLKPKPDKFNISNDIFAKFYWQKTNPTKIQIGVLILKDQSQNTFVSQICLCTLVRREIFSVKFRVVLLPKWIKISYTFDYNILGR